VTRQDQEPIDDDAPLDETFQEHHREYREYPKVSDVDKDLLLHMSVDAVSATLAGNSIYMSNPVTQVMPGADSPRRAPVTGKDVQGVKQLSPRVLKQSKAAMAALPISSQVAINLLPVKHPASVGEAPVTVTTILSSTDKTIATAEVVVVENEPTYFTSLRKFEQLTASHTGWLEDNGKYLGESVRLLQNKRLYIHDK